MKICNLYAGVGGNRKLWGDTHDITAVEHDTEVAKIYSDYYPNDSMIVTDAHAYLLEHFQEYDFIWASPPCPTHSDIRRMAVDIGRAEPVYPDMTLYQEILLLQNFYKGLYCIENVKPYYEPLISGLKRGRHIYWTNFYIPEFEKKDDRPKIHKHIISNDVVYGYDLSKYKINNKRQILRNMVNPELGKHILDAAIRQEQLFFKETT
jgi:DNA (cytosine-5)-methyltransferase 1